MTKRNESRPPTAKTDQAGNTSKTGIEVLSVDQKNLPRWKTVDIIRSEQSDGTSTIGVLFDSTVTLYWLDLYEKLGMSQEHASKILKKLTEEIHYIKLSRSEIKAILDSNANLALLPVVKVYYFITEEGWYRAIQEIGTGSMVNRDIAANIDQLKNEMAAVYAKFRRGELVYVVARPDISKIDDKKSTLTTLNTQVGSLVSQKLVPIYREKHLNPKDAYSNEHRALNGIVTGIHERDQKNKLNSTGLDVSIATRISDITLLKADILVDKTRWEKVKEVIDDVFPDRANKNLKLSEQEQAMIKRGCDENQQSLFDTFSSPKQLAGGQA